MVLKTNPNFIICGNAENIDMGFKLINKSKPDLVLLDIKMPGGSGFELLQKFEKPNFEVVFITGFDEYAINAFKYNALDYILKPIDTDKLRDTLTRVYDRIRSKLSITNNLKEIINSYNIDYTRIAKIPVHNNDTVHLIEIDSITSLESNEGYTVFSTKDYKKYTSSKQLSAFEFIIEHKKNFCRISKSVYININFIKKYTKKQVCEITLIDDSVFEVSRRKKTEILELLDRK
ncbi:MAG: LytR/AlgR family response regulator transcription factor [Bacteroidota bacterium]